MMPLSVMRKDDFHCRGGNGPRESQVLNISDQARGDRRWAAARAAAIMDRLGVTSIPATVGIR
jgi:hypothetical protein